MEPTAYETFLTDVESVITSIKTGITFFNSAPLVYYVYLAFGAAVLMAVRGLIPQRGRK